MQQMLPLFHPVMANGQDERENTQEVTWFIFKMKSALKRTVIKIMSV